MTNRTSRFSENFCGGIFGGNLIDSCEANHVFNGYELLLLRELQNDHLLCEKVKDRLINKSYQEEFNILDISQNFWFLTMTLDRKKDRFLEFIYEQMQKACTIHARNDTLLGRYLSSYNFTELHLDAIFKYGDNNTLPLEIFKCVSVRSLSLKYNYLEWLPADIGRMNQLENLSLTNNKLQNRSIPFSIVFCSRLKVLKLDNNQLDALPGFLLDMPSLHTVHRHGNHNYFKSTFMWYHTDVNERILPVFCEPIGLNEGLASRSSLQFVAARSLISTKTNFFIDSRISAPLIDYIAESYRYFQICAKCATAKIYHQPGFKVITFKNPYLGNTCVPFQHWACSLNCAMEIEIPAREEQILAAREQDRRYESFTRECQDEFIKTRSSRRAPLNCAANTRRSYISLSESSPQPKWCCLPLPSQSH